MNKIKKIASPSVPRQINWAKSAVLIQEDLASRSEVKRPCQWREAASLAKQLCFRQAEWRKADFVDPHERS